MNDVRRRLQFPAIGLIIVGALNALSGLVLILGRLVSIVKGPDRVITDEDRRLGYMVAGIFFPIVSLISIAASPIIIFGGIQMLRARRYSIALWAAILALIPLTSVCCIPGIPIGIWALIVLRHPEVRTSFEGYQVPRRQQYQN
jgi:type IV secretory pathway protease TraF